MGNKIPSSWLEDPEWEMLRRKAEKQPISKELKKKVADQRPKPSMRREIPHAQVGKEATEKEVVVNLKVAVPKIKIPSIKNIFRNHRKPILIAGSALLVLSLAFGGYQFYADRRSTEEAKKPVTPEEQAGENFNPLVPLPNLTDKDGKQVATPEFKFDSEKKVLGYQTEYNEAVITLS